MTDTTQQAAMRTMVKTYGQMPAQLFREQHPQRTNTSPVLTTFRMRLGNALKRLAFISPYKITNTLFWNNVSLHKVRISTSSHDCDFVGTSGSLGLICGHSSRHDRIPERMVCTGNRELVITGKKALFVQNTSPAHSSLLLAWDNWDNSLLVQSTLYDIILPLHSHPFNNVSPFHHN